MSEQLPQEQEQDFGWWWHLAGQQAVKQEVEKEG